jgi:hypothetical protein
MQLEKQADIRGLAYEWTVRLSRFIFGSGPMPAIEASPPDANRSVEARYPKKL